MGEKVACTVTTSNLRNERGFFQSGFEVVCHKCGQITSAFGTSEKSVKRCLAQLRETCLLGEVNFYYADEGERENGSGAKR
jgi:hypothetical protein